MFISIELCKERNKTKKKATDFILKTYSNTSNYIKCASNMPYSSLM